MIHSDFQSVQPTNAKPVSLNALQDKACGTKNTTTLPVGSVIVFPGSLFEVDDDNNLALIITESVTINKQSVDVVKVACEVNGEKKFIAVNSFANYLWLDAKEFDKLNESLNADKSAYTTMLAMQAATTLYERVAALQGKRLTISERPAGPFTDKDGNTRERRYLVYKDNAE